MALILGSISIITMLVVSYTLGVDFFLNDNTWSISKRDSAICWS